MSDTSLAPGTPGGPPARLVTLPLETYHGELIVLGYRDGLVALSNAITRALGAADGMAHAELVPPDGEGYDLVVSVVTPEEWARLGTPYATTSPTSYRGEEPPVPESILERVNDRLELVTRERALARRNP